MTTRQVQPCGTIAAYQRHIQAGESTCKACRAAQSQYVRNLRALRGRAPRTLDPVAVERAVAGNRPDYMTHAERAEAVRRLHHRRLADPDIAGVLGISTRTVLRIRGRLGLPAVPPELRAVA